MTRSAAPKRLVHNGLNWDDKVKFEPEQVNGQFTIMKIEKAR